MRVLSKIISYLMHPLFGPSFGMLMLFNTVAWHDTGIKTEHKLWLLGLVFSLTFLFPVLVITALKLANLISDFHLNDRHERRLPFAIVAISYCLVYYIIGSNFPISFFTNMFLALSASVILALVINAFYKISIHTICAGGLVAMGLVFLPYFYFDARYFLLVLILLAGLVGTSRLWLNAHTPGQVYSGYIVGFLTVYLILPIQI